MMVLAASKAATYFSHQDEATRKETLQHVKLYHANGAPIV
jgi:hypothetical protein